MDNQVQIDFTVGVSLLALFISSINLCLILMISGKLGTVYEDVRLAIQHMTRARADIAAIRNESRRDAYKTRSWSGKKQHTTPPELDEERPI